MSFKTLFPNELSTSEVHATMLGAIAPRPIAFVSTVDKEGRINLSPYSFFNAFGANPPTLIFSPALRGRDGKTKHTLENIQEVGEAVVNIVSLDMVQQMSLASTEYPKGVNEFIKAGFSMEKSIHVAPPRVRESPAQFECVVKQVISTGTQGGAGNLVICEIVAMHIREDVLDQNGRIDPFRIDQVSRLGGDWYGRAAKGLFKVPKPLMTLGIGVDQMPDPIRTSRVLTGNDLGRLGNVEKLPTREEIDSYLERQEVKKLLSALQEDTENLTTSIHLTAHHLLEQGEVDDAWKLLLSHHS
jgi:flavin reductase (DIM6/NTAB) family NADH-FMN oxidoreductase RutF